MLPRPQQQRDISRTAGSAGLVDRKGRPNPYMIFRNMQFLGLTDVRRVMKVGDTVSDIREGKNAGLFTVGVIEGSSAMGLSRRNLRRFPQRKRKNAASR